MILILSLVLAGCVTVTVQAPSKTADLPIFPMKGRAPAASDSNLSPIHFAQIFCADQNFYFKAEAAQNASQPNPNCITLSEEEMYSPVPVQLSLRSKTPAGNFADVVLERVLKYEDKSFREMATKELREYEIRTGQCGSKLFFLVTLASKKRPEADPKTNLAASYCRFDQPEKVFSVWPLAGVYPRVYGEPLQNFKRKLGLQTQGI